MNFYETTVDQNLNGHCAICWPVLSDYYSRNGSFLSTVGYHPSALAYEVGYDSTEQDIL